MLQKTPRTENKTQRAYAPIETSGPSQCPRIFILVSTISLYSVLA